jgi:deazaflavin-dependent oxidoreductase (nitroreductase family)
VPLAPRVVDLGFKFLNSLHRSALRLSGGRVGARGMGMDLIELHHTGRTSGSARVTMLSTPLVEPDGTVVLVASKGGDDRDPEWFKNVVENPTVELWLRGERRGYLARVATAPERAALWPRITAVYRFYDRYQSRTHRLIPVVLCTPNNAEVAFRAPQEPPGSGGR